MNKGPLSELQTDSSKHTGQKIVPEGLLKTSNKQLKTVGQAIYSTYGKKCKENLGKSLSDILILVPETGLERKLSPVEKRKLKRNQQRKLKTDIENKMSESDTEEHLVSRQSYWARQYHRLVQTHETIGEATERARVTPSKVKERTHVPTSDNIIKKLDQLLEDINTWSSGLVNWSEKARLYKIRTTGRDSTPPPPPPPPNGGQMIKSFFTTQRS